MQYGTKDCLQLDTKVVQRIKQRKPLEMGIKYDYYPSPFRTFGHMLAKRALFFTHKFDKLSIYRMIKERKQLCSEVKTTKNERSR